MLIVWIFLSCFFVIFNCFFFKQARAKPSGGPKGGGPKGGGPKGGGPKGGGPKGGGPKGGGPKGGGPKGGGPKGGEPQISRFFSLSRHKIRSFLPSLGVFGALKCARLEFSGCRVKPRRPRQRASL